MFKLEINKKKCSKIRIFKNTSKLLHKSKTKSDNRKKRGIDIAKEVDKIITICRWYDYITGKPKRKLKNY